MNEKKEIKLRVPESVQPGTYANNTLVSHTREEFMMDFIMLAPPGGTVVSRVVVSPAHFKRLIATLQDNIEKYEANFGPVSLGELPPMTMGFSG